MASNLRPILQGRPPELHNDVKSQILANKAHPLYCLCPIHVHYKIGKI